jgi:hypothetical protein
MLLQATPMSVRAEAELDAGELTHVALLRRLSEEAVEEMLADLKLPNEPIVVRPRLPHAANSVVADVVAARLTRAGITVRVVDAPLESASASATDATATQEAAAVQGTAQTTGAASDSAGAAFGSTEPASGELLGHLAQQEGTILRPADRPALASVSTGPAVEGPTLLFDVSQFAVRYVSEGRSFFLGAKRVERAATVDVSCRFVEGPSGTIRGIGHGDALALDAISKGKLALYESEGMKPTLETRAGALRYAEPVVVGGILVGLIYLFYTNQN